MTDIIQDISTLTTIPISTLKQLVAKENLCICHSLEDSIGNGECETTLDIGIGKLIIFADSESIKYKFIPSHKLEESIKETVQTGKSPLIAEVENSLKQKVMNVYKEMM